MFLSKFFHRHKWEVVEQGVVTKRNGDTFPCFIEKCACGAERGRFITPFRSVKVDVEWLKTFVEKPKKK